MKSVEKPFVDFTELSIPAREIFTLVDRMMGNDKYLEVTKEELAFLLMRSVPGIKLGLRELKQTGYIVTEHVNDIRLQIGKPYGFQTVDKGEYRK